MSGLLTRGGGENVPSSSSTCTTRSFTYGKGSRRHCLLAHLSLWQVIARTGPHWIRNIVILTKFRSLILHGSCHYLNYYWTRSMNEISYCVINSSPPSAAYIFQWIGSALLQIMACRLFGAKSLSKPVLGYCQLDLLGNKLQWNFNQNTELFIHEDAPENIVCKWRPFCPTGDEFSSNGSIWCYMMSLTTMPW